MRCTCIFRSAKRKLLHLARQNVAEEAERVVQRLVIDRLVEVLDEDVADARLAQRRVALAPHDAARLALDERVVHRVERALRVRHVVEVDVRVPERAARDRVAAHADGSDRPDGVEDLKEQALRNTLITSRYAQRTSEASAARSPTYSDAE